MLRQTNDIVIHASPTDVFAYVNQPRTMPDWMIDVVDVRNVVGHGEGLQYDFTYKMVGIPLRGQNVLVEYVENELAVHQSIGMFRSTWQVVVEPVRGATRLTLSLDYSIPFPVLEKLAETAVKRRIERDGRDSLRNAKELLEARAPRPRDHRPRA